ncbi:hypothetical protein H4Q26_003853 [Puccinia striiformis f. sp. tritici PST-130]|nr:hypothetical protein H4Q26_003853 [Puccinia striiformis f. sp. tritici PST-130]
MDRYMLTQTTWYRRPWHHLICRSNLSPGSSKTHIKIIDADLVKSLICVVADQDVLLGDLPQRKRNLPQKRRAIPPTDSTSTTGPTPPTDWTPPLVPIIPPTP